MRLSRWVAATGAVLLVSIPITAQAAVLPSPSPNVAVPSISTNTSTAASSGLSTIGAGTTSALHQTVTNVTGNVTGLTPNASNTQSSSSVHSATTTQIIPAPPSAAEAYAANVLNAIAISHTAASATGNSQSSATANVLEIGGKPLASPFGGTVTNGTGGGNLFDSTQLTIPTSALHLLIAPWSASASPGSSSAIADLLVLTLGDTQANPGQSATVKVLQSTSNANWTSGQSTSNATSDGAYVNVGGAGGLTIDLLHSDTSSTAPGSSYLISINGNQIGSNGQVGGQCALTIPGLISLSCLTAVGGLVGNVTTGASQVLGITLNPGGANLPINLITSNAGSGLGGTVTVPGVSPVTGGQAVAGNAGTASQSAGASAAPAQPAAAQHGALAFTGLGIPMLLGIALLLLMTGTGLFLWARRRGFVDVI